MSSAMSPGAVGKTPQEGTSELTVRVVAGKGALGGGNSMSEGAEAGRPVCVGDDKSPRGAEWGVEGASWGWQPARERRLRSQPVEWRSASVLSPVRHGGTWGLHQ